MYLLDGFINSNLYIFFSQNGINIVCFRSSLYYWAHYDFFNNTKFGRPVANTACDEEFASWRKSKGYLRSPTNTLVYKKPETSGNLKCRYTFVTDRRLYARLVLTINNIYFKVRSFRFSDYF